MNGAQLLGATETGLFYALVSLAAWITLRVIQFPDLTVDGTFTLGAAVTAVTLAAGIHPVLALFLSTLASCCAGLMTALLHVKAKIPGLMASILVTTGLYSINMRIMGKPNVSIDMDLLTGSQELALSASAVLFLILFLYWLFLSNFGLAIRAIGINPKVCPAYGIKLETMQETALSLSNAIVNFTGGCFAIAQGFSHISMGTDIIVVGSAAVMIGEAICGKDNLLLTLIGCVLSSILYRIGVGFALNAHAISLQPSDTNLITAILIVMMINRPRTS
ncbi:hypothetical protein BCY86_03100 [Pajaroellobacter abortibovis]|uniref:ABC transporter permease n=2 Tax=Pajaroellobacter abortibovis TaxID=1882918 RepID=A0A1L6MZ97_9BACT|nr:hypothetical protein BCY86_03100 [Pajaroellobacter abortibovis]